MISNKRTFFLGIFIFIIPFLGFPSSWKTIFIVVSGVVLVLMSLKLSLPRKTTRVKSKKERTTPVFVENIPIYSRGIAVESNIKSDKSDDSLK